MTQLNEKIKIWHLKHTVPTRNVSSLKKIVLKTNLYFFSDISVENEGRIFVKKRLESLLEFASNKPYLIYF